MPSHARPLVSLVLFLAGVVWASALELENGQPATPPEAQMVVGRYHRDERLGYEIMLTLRENGTYSAQWRSSRGRIGSASGDWMLSNERILLRPKRETEKARGRLKTLNVLKYRGEWIFVSTSDKEFYEKHGVSRGACFRRSDLK